MYEKVSDSSKVSPPQEVQIERAVPTVLRQEEEVQRKVILLSE